MTERRRTQIAVWLATPGALLCLSACAANPSIETLDPTEAAKSNSPGFRYYLPVDRLKVEASRTSTTTYRPKLDLSQREKVKTKTERSLKVDIHTMADPRVPYPLDLSPSQWTDGTLKVVLNGNGTLASINADSTGRAGDVINNVARLASTLLTLATPGLGAQANAANWPARRDCYAIDRLPPEVRARYFVQAPPPSTKWKIDKATLPSRELQILLLGSKEACEAWQEVKTDAWRVEQRRRKVRELEDQLSAAPEAQKPAIRAQLSEARTLLARAEAELRSRETIFEAIESAKLKEWELTPSVDKAPPRVEWISPEKLPPTSLVLADPQRSTVSPALAAQGMTESQRLLDEVGYLITRAPVAAAATAQKEDACKEAVSDDKGRLYYRQAIPTVLTTWELNDSDVLEFEKDEIEELIAPAPVRCVEFTASGFAVHKLALTFDAKGRPKSMDRSTTSAAAGATGALATAAVTARDAYVETLAKLAEADASKRTLELSELETELATLKKEKEILDTKLALEGGEASRDLVLQQQTLEAQLELLQAELALEQAKEGADLQLDVAQLKLQLEQLQQQVAILQAQAQLRAAQAGN